MSDSSSHSNPHEAVVSHLQWFATVDFDAEVLAARAKYTVNHLDKGSAAISLDTANLRIQSVSSEEVPLRFILHPIDTPHLGQKLEIFLPNQNVTAKDDIEITIEYKTTEKCSALQWLPPSQTAGKQYPYLFTQCQAIHARSLVPCQDTCGVKMTYEAHVTVPRWATCVCSALYRKTSIADEDGTHTFTWIQPIPISSYLLAIAVGELRKRDISSRCSIWAEPSVVDAAAYEFAQTEDFLVAAETISGTNYAWGRYDLLCLPPSFPYGGMENTCLTFVTPTLLAGDRSLADVVAHEIAHSWTGNLITNTTWDHFWLNEGWTTFFQRKIMAKIKKDQRVFDFDAIGGRNALRRAIEHMPENLTTLVLDIGDNDPDDSYSRVAYEKGFALLHALERRVGAREFESFFQEYVSHFARRTLTSDDFKEFFLRHFEGNDKLSGFDWDGWFYQPGMPEELPELDQSMAKACQHLAHLWLEADRGKQTLLSITDTTNGQSKIDAWSSPEIVCFLDSVIAASESTTPLKQSTIQSMNEIYHFAESRNAEILYRFCTLAVASEYSDILPVVIRFITTQGRMKFVRPLYRALHRSKMGRQLAIDAFLSNTAFYHPIAAKMIASDLKVGIAESSSLARRSLVWVGTAFCVAAIGVVVLRKRK